MQQQNDRADSWFQIAMQLLLVSALIGMFAGVALASELTSSSNDARVEVFTLGETETFVEGGTTITVEPAIMKLFN